MDVRAKKHLGQHFLTDEGIAAQIADGLIADGSFTDVLEIGPGMGVLTKYLVQNTKFNLRVIELDRESIVYLHEHFPQLHGNIIDGDFLHYPPDKIFGDQFSIIGNFPYNISSQILFRVLDFKERIPQVVGMFQKEVAERIASGPGNRDYGILSVFMQAYYTVEYLFTVPEHVFNPPPRVKSGVIRCVRKANLELGCEEKLFRNVVKTAFNQRRKMLRNSLNGLFSSHGVEIPAEYREKRPEQLAWTDFVALSSLIENRA